MEKGMRLPQGRKNSIQVLFQHWVLQDPRNRHDFLNKESKTQLANPKHMPWKSYYLSPAVKQGAYVPNKQLARH